MKIFSQNDKYKLYQGNMLDMLEVIEPESIDSIITDPPYELNFMGKGWDNSGIAFQPNTWQKCYEVLKPGGYLLAFGGSRTFHRIACAIEDAGFEIRDTIMWLYGSGFPKSMDISKQLDKRNGRTNNEFYELGNYLKENITDSDSACAKKIGFSSALVRFWKLGERIPNKETWVKLKNVYNLNDNFDWLIEREEAEREIIGNKKTKDFSKHNGSMMSFTTTGDYKTDTTNIGITTPATDLAKKWQGWGTALKPSFEPIIVARKPFKGSLVDNVIEYGVGGINIDECRVDFVNDEDYKITANKNQHEKFGTPPMTNNNVYGDYSMIQPKNYSAKGRFPANTILTYDETPSDEKLRYFYCAKASKKDRDEGLEEFELKGAKELLNREENSDGASWNGKYSSGNAYAGAGCPKKNTHPTVKPTELMQYLVRLVTPNNGTILDPFNGSGSTGKAVMYENRENHKEYKYIGIELTEEYLPISKARIEYVCGLNEEELKDKQLTIFDIKE